MHLAIHDADKGKVIYIKKIDMIPQIIIHIPRYLTFKTSYDKYGRLHITLGV